MTKSVYIVDIIVRSFFIFVVCFLLLSYFIVGVFWTGLLAVLATAGINAAYEFTLGRKRWKQFKAVEKKKRRTPRQVAKDLWAKIFSREKTKGFIWVGIIIMFMSFFVRLNVYYIVFACVVFTMAAISRFAPPVKRDIIKENETDIATDEVAGEEVSEEPANA